MKKWKLIKENERVNDVNGSCLINTYACPSCNWKVRTEGEMEYHFCPMCGEDLRGKETENKGDLISREALKKAYFNAINETSIGEVSIIDIIDNAPTAESTIREEQEND